MSLPDDDNDSTRGVTVAELARRQVRAELAESMRSMIPARVEKVHTDANGKLARVDCKPLIKDFHRDETGALVVASVPIVTSVPVVFLTAGGFTFTVPLEAGKTTGALFFADRSLDRWLSGDGVEVDPELYVRSSLTDAIFVPGLVPFGATSPAAPTDHATAGSIDGPRIHFRSNKITIGDESGSKKLVLDGDHLTASAPMGAWAGVIEALLGALCTATMVPNTITALNQFSGSGAGNPGKAENLGTVVSSATEGYGK